MNKIFDEVLSKTDNNNVFKQFITPISPYYICNHFISTEINPPGWKYIGFDLNLKSNDLLKNNNYNDIKDLDIIQIQVDEFIFFCNTVLPIIEKNNIRVIIITSQEHLPQIHRNEYTDRVLNHPNILLWIGQNPIYNDPKYMAFPSGIRQHNIFEYTQFAKSYNTNNPKSIKILNQCARAHPHLPQNHIRNAYTIFGRESGCPISYNDFLTNISNAEFVISTSGDRDDCYRHYECIGLDAIPVSNIGGDYKNIFNENMLYSNAEEMVNMVTTGTVNYPYTKPNKDILTMRYWENQIQNKIYELLSGRSL
jgi:hypothetical protein